MSGAMKSPPTSVALSTRLRDEAAEWDDGEDIPALLLEAAEAIELLAVIVALNYARAREAPP